MAFDLLVNPVNYILLGGQKSPGLVEIVGAKAEYEYLVRQANFTTGARQLYKYRKLSEFEVRIRCYSTDELIAFDQWRSILRAPDKRSLIVNPDAKLKKGSEGAVMRALDIWHPLLEDLEIKAVVVLSVGQFDQVDHGVWQVTIRFRQHIGVPVVTQRPVEGAQATPEDPADAATAAQSLANRKAIAARVNELGGGP